MTSDALERLRYLRQEQEDIACTYHLPGLADLDIVKATLPFASTRRLPAQIGNEETHDYGVLISQRAESYFVLRYSSLLQDELTSKDDTALIDLAGHKTEDDMKAAIVAFWNSTELHRTEFRKALECIIQDKKKAQTKLESYLSSAAHDIVVVPKLHWPESNVVELSYVPLSDKGVLGYVLMVLLKKHEIRNRLRKCHADSCQDFFLTDGPAGGGPRFRYCSDLCRKAQRKIQLMDAQEDFQKRKKESGKTSTRRKRKRKQI